MFLSHNVIKKYIDEKMITVGPTFDEKNIRPVGLRMHLGRYLLLPKAGQVVDLTTKSELSYTEVDLTKEEFFIEPGEFLLASTYETIKTCADIVAILDGRSTIARLGLTTHITASVIDGTYEQPHAATLEIKNVGNFKIRLKYMDPIAMMLFAKLDGEVTQPLQRQYMDNPERVTPPIVQNWK